MILKERFDPVKVAGYIWEDMALATVAVTGAYASYHALDMKAAALPFPILGVLGTALAIFLAFRNNTAYTRWIEASQYWQNITTHSRILGRLIMTFVHSHKHTQQYDPEQAALFQRHMLHRQIAWVNALRFQLRGQNTWAELKPYLPAEEYATLLTKENKPAYLMQQQGHHIYEAMAKGVLQGFDSFQLEGALAQLAAQQSGCERLKAIPIPRQYTYFTRIFVQILVILLPFCLLSLLTTWLIFPLAWLTAFLFVTVERVGAVNEYPFENRITDVPLTAYCNGIERDLLECLGETTLPPRAEARDGYIF